MFHAQGGRRLSILWMSAAAFLFLSILAVTIARANVDSSPTLTGGKVIPENGAWGSTFTFEVVYTDPDNLLPAEGYPRVYINGEAGGRAMVENDPADNDVKDGKLYKYEWKPSIENEKKLPLLENFKVNNNYPNLGQAAIFSGYLIDNHDFYFYAGNISGENARDPATGVHKGLRVAVSGRTVRLLLLGGDNSIVGQDNTDENGYFSISINASSSGSYGYFAKFEGDEYHESSLSDMEYLITFNALTISTISGVFSVILILVLIFLLSRGISKAQYLQPVLIGLLVAIVFSFLLAAGFIGLIMTGAVAGYLYASKASGWSKHLRVGGLVASFLLLGLIFVRAYFIKETAAYYVVNIVGRSIGDGELLQLLVVETIFSAFFYIIFVGLGAILGGLLRKALKPAEQRPFMVAGPATTAASR